MTDNTQDILLTVDVVIFTVCENKIKTLVLKRDKNPYEGCFALPGGFVHQDEDINSLNTAKRMLLEKVGSNNFFLEQLSTYASKNRDPRRWSASIAYYCLANYSTLKPLLDSNHNLKMIDVKEIINISLAFDHHEIIKDALKRLQGKGSYSSLPVHLLDKNFTLSQLQSIYETILETKLDKSSFRRKIEELGFIKETSEKDCSSKRPAKLYTLNEHNVFIFDRNI